MWKNEIKKKYNIRFVDDKDKKTYTTTNLYDPNRLVDAKIAEQFSSLHKDLQRMGPNILESALRIYNENVGPNGTPIDISVSELIPLLRRLEMAMRGYVQYFERN